MESIGPILNIGLTLGLLLVGYIAGQWFERRHYASLQQREARLQHLMALPLKSAPGVDASVQPTLVTGAVCVSIDYFKRFAAALRNLFGGRMRSYESVIDRGRREAILRMKEAAERQGYDMVLCVRIETSRIASTMGGGDGVGGIEVVAYGTAVRRAA